MKETRQRAPHLVDGRIHCQDEATPTVPCRQGSGHGCVKSTYGGGAGLVYARPPIMGEFGALTVLPVA